MEMGSHAELADLLRSRVGLTGITDPDVRRAVFDRAAGGDPIGSPYDELADQIASAAHRVTDAQVAAVRQRVTSDRAALEVVLAAAAGAGLKRWDAASRVIGEVRDATS